MRGDRVFQILLQDTPSGLQSLSLVMIASQLRKLARSTRNARPGLRQHTPCNRDHVRCRNVPHAAMVVHGADRTMAGLAWPDGLGLYRRRNAAQGRPLT